MANYKISDLPAAVSISGTDLFEIESTISKSATLSLVAQYVLANGTNITLTGGTVTSSTPLIDATQTWNNAGVTFTALKLDITDSASASGSLLADLQVGGVSKFNVSKAGNLSFGNGAALGSISANGAGRVFISATLGAGATVYGNLSIGGTILERDATNTLAQRNGANAQAFRLYNTYTDASNYERGVIGWSANTLTIGTEKAGTGSTRALELQTNGTTWVTIATNGVTTFASNILAPNGLRVGSTTDAFGALLDTNNGLLLKSTVPMAFSSATNNGGDLRSTIDGGISRLGPASLAVGNGTVGDTSGTMTASGQRIVPATAPAAPATGWTIFCDSGDGNKLKAIYSTGTVATIATP